MGQDDDGQPDRIVGLPLDEAVDAVVARDGSRDRETVRATLEGVAEDGVVTREAVEAALADASKVVSTPETRVELASIALSDAREAAEPVADLDAVRSRLDAFESRLAAAEERADGLAADLEALVRRRGDPGAVYEVAEGLGRLTAEANDVQAAADDLRLDIEAFERWLDDPDARFRELGEDMDAVEASLDGLSGTVEALRSEPGEFDDAGAVWADTALRRRVVSLLLADVRAELADLRAWADREGIDAGDRADELEERVDELDARLASLGGALHDLARPGWTERFDERLRAFGSEADRFEPPIDWGEVEAAFEEHRPGGTDAG